MFDLAITNLVLIAKLIYSVISLRIQVAFFIEFDCLIDWPNLVNFC